jgi:hypothetical protein
MRGMLICFPLICRTHLYHYSTLILYFFVRDFWRIQELHGEERDQPYAHDIPIIFQHNDVPYTAI